MNHPCTYIGCFPDLVNHLMNECEYLLYECCWRLSLSWASQTVKGTKSSGQQVQLPMSQKIWTERWRENII